MRITDVKTVLLSGPSTHDPFLRESRANRSASFIEVHTDTEHTGIGESYGGYFCPELVAAAVEFYKPILLGKNVDDIDQLWAWMYQCENFWGRVGLGPIVLTGIEAALWDLKGKLLGQPVYELLGGRRHDALPCYATGGPTNYPKDRLAQKIDFYLSLGFRAFKLGSGSVQDGKWFAPKGKQATVDFEADKLAFVRKHVGPDIGVMLDGHMGNSPTDVWTVDIAAAVLRAMEPFHLLFYEEPLHYTDAAGYAELCRLTEVDVAGGECLTGTCEWMTFIDRDCFDVGQPDASFTGGLRVCMRVAQMLHAKQRRIATHAWGAGGSLMQNVHFGFAAPNTLILEVPPAYGPLHSLIVGDSFRMRDGRVLPPDKPGLGITLTDEIKNQFPYVPGTAEHNSVPGKVMSL